MTKMATNAIAEKPVAPFVLSLLAGLLILAGGGMMAVFSSVPYYGGMMAGYDGMMNGYYPMMGGYGGGWFYAFSAEGIISGILVTILLYAEPGRAYTWGVLILVFSALSFFGMGGFMLGALLGGVGGMLAVTWKRV